MRDLHNNIDGGSALTPRNVNANGTINGDSIDLKGYGALEFLILSGTITDGTHAVNVQHSDDGAAWSEVTAADLLDAEPSFAATDDNTLKQVGYVGGKRFARVQVVSSGVTTGGFFSAIAAKGRERHTGGQAV